MSESTPVTTQSVSKSAAVTVFVVNTVVILAVGALSGTVLAKTARLSVSNLGHLLTTKGKIWEDSKYRHLEIPVRD